MSALSRPLISASHSRLSKRRAWAHTRGMITIRSLHVAGTAMAALLLAGQVCAAESGLAASPEASALARLGRPVRVLSLSFRDKPRDEIERLVDREASSGADLVILPETWLGQKDHPEPLDGPVIGAF